MARTGLVQSTTTIRSLVKRSTWYYIITEHGGMQVLQAIALAFAELGTFLRKVFWTLD